VSLSEVVGSVRRHLRITLAAGVLTAVVLAGYLITRQHNLEPDKFRTEVELLVPAGPSPDEGEGTGGGNEEDTPLVTAIGGMPLELVSGQEALALSPEVRQAALEASNRPGNDASIRFAASLNTGRDILTLAVVAGDSKVSQTVVQNYTTAVLDARRRVSADSIESTRRSLVSNLEVLRRRLADVEQDLRGRLVAPPPATPEAADGAAVPNVEVPPGADLDTTLLLYERTVLASRIAETQFRYAEFAVESNTPSAFANVFARRATQRIVAEDPSPVVPSAIILAAGAVLGVGGAVIADRADRSIRSIRAAAAAFSAPVLSTVPPRRRGDSRFVVLERPQGARSEAFRALAATCVATDRLPRAIVVSTPQGGTFDDVAANFAGALASLGLQVALVPTSPTQTWYLDPFPEPTEQNADLPELLRQAHAGRLNGQVRRRLLPSDLYPNLVIAVPGPQLDPSVPLDGLPPLLDDLARSGIDVTVIAGPPLLRDANATIVAWATRSVLWAVQLGKTTQQEAADAAARLDLTGVSTFGVVVVGAAES